MTWSKAGKNIGWLRFDDRIRRRVSTTGIDDGYRRRVSTTGIDDRIVESW
jgi:hypothetical protein